MSQRSVRKDGFSLLGVGVVACIACCAGPILGVLGGITFAGLAATTVLGSAGLMIAVVAGAAWLFVLRKQRRSLHDVHADGQVAVGPPTRKP